MGFILPMVGAGTAGAASFGSVISGVGTALGAFGSLMQGISESKTARYNAQISLNNAKIARQNASLAGQEGEIRAGMAGAKTKAAVGAILAQQGASGLDVNLGSPVSVRASEAKVGMADVTNIRANAARTAYGYQVEAASDIAQANLYKSEARNAMLGGIVGAGTTILGGAASGASAYESYLQNSSNLNPMGSSSFYPNSNTWVDWK